MFWNLIWFSEDSVCHFFLIVWLCQFQDARKGVLFIDFPPVLQLQLKRFEYDFMRDTMVKVGHLRPHVVSLWFWCIFYTCFIIPWSVFIIITCQWFRITCNNREEKGECSALVAHLVDIQTCWICCVFDLLLISHAVPMCL